MTSNSPERIEPAAAGQGQFRPLRLALLYVLLGVLWIVLTDWAVDLLVADRVGLILTGTLKGIVFVLGTGGLVYWLGRRVVDGVCRRLLAEQLRETENLLDKVMANLEEAVFLIRPSDRTIRRCNAAATSMFGYGAGELLGCNTAILHVDQAAYLEFGCLSEPALGAAGVFRGQYRMRRKDGGLLDTEHTVLSLQDSLGWQAGVISIVRDVTERTRSRAALQASEERYRLLAENSLDVIWAMNMELEFTYVNPAVLPLTGYTPEEFVGMRLQALCDRETFADLRRLIEREISKGPDSSGVIVQIRLLGKGGAPVPVEVRGRVIFGEGARPTGLQGIARDISQRLALEGQLRQSQKMEAIGTLAAGVAHEINNPVMGITNYAELIGELAGEGSQIGALAGEIRGEMERIHAIVNNLLGFARSEEAGGPRPVRLAEIVESSRSLIHTLMRRDQIELRVDIPEELPTLLGHSQQIQQVVMNLLTNARDALNSKYPTPDPGKLIRLAGGVVDHSGRTWVRLTVEDTGPGIPEAVRSRMFEPFFTTKPAGQGSGLGLWIVYSIVQAHGGEIQAESEVGRYTRFHIDLPAGSASA